MFVVEKAKLGSDFAQMTEVAANGSTSLSNSYKTTDADVIPGNTYSYRLNVVDFSGNQTYSNVKNVAIDANSNVMVLSAPVPNPATDAIDVNFTLANTADIRLSLYDITGKEVAVISTATFNAGAHTLHYSLNGIPSGSYNVVLSANGLVLSQTFTIAK
jgi:hypothetical protein